MYPLLLGEIFRSRQQIRDLAGRLLKKQHYSDGVIGEFTDFLCSDSGSHDYTINRREAKELGLAHHFVTEGVMEPIPNNGEVIPQETLIRDRRIFEGWRKIL